MCVLALCGVELRQTSSRVRFRSGAAYQCKHHAASCINKFKANIDQGEFPERSKHYVASCVNRFTVQ